MSKIFKKVTLYFVAIMAMMATSCSDDLAAVDPIAADDLSGDRTITFTATVEAETRGYATISDFDYYRIYAYNSTEVNDGWFIDGAEMKFADNEWIIDNTYEMPSSGTSYFFAISDQGIANSGVNFVKEDVNSYVEYTMPNDVESQPNLLMAVPVAMESGFVVDFAFKYSLSPVALEATGDGYYAIEEVTISNYYNSAKFTFDIDSDGNFSKEENVTYLDSKAGAYTIASNPGVTSGAITNATSGWLMMPPQSTEGFELDIKSYHYEDGVKDSDTNGERVATITEANAEDLGMGDSCTFYIGTGKIESESADGYKEATGDNDYTSGTKTDSNCYIITTGVTTEQIYHIPIEGRINDFWTNYSSVSANRVSDTTRDALTVEQLWYDSDDDPSDVGMEVSLVMKGDEKVMQVKVAADYGNIGNTVYAVKNADGTILWSWHLWMTDYTPTTTYLNRFVGQRATTSIVGAAVYQFGRKDPFVDDVDAITTGTSGSYEKSVLNPTVMYKLYNTQSGWASDYNYYTYYNWGDVNNMTLGSKSIYDPSPYGYRLLQTSEASTVVNGSTFYLTYYYYLYSEEYVYMRAVASVLFDSFKHTLGTTESAFWTTHGGGNVSAYSYLARIYGGSSTTKRVENSTAYRSYAYPVLSIQE